MAENNLAFSKVVANPTPNAWSQAYSAGKLFAALSLESTSPDTNQDLPAIGKDIISTLESEFFTIESKDLESIKGAVETTIARVGENVKPSFIVCYLSDNVLYLYAIGGGKSVLKRGDKIGTVLEGESNGNSIKSASGYVQDGDVIVLQTSQFQKIISSSTLASSLDKSTPDEISEELAPHIHERSEGGASAVILVYKIGAFEDVPVATVVATAEEPEKEDEIIGEVPTEATNTLDTNEENTEIEASENIESEKAEEAETPVINPEVEAIPNLAEPKETAFTPINQNMNTSNPEEIRPFENQPPPHIANPEFAAKEAVNDDLPESPFLTETPRSRRKLGFKLPNIGGIKKLSKSRKIIAIIAVLLALIIIIAIIFAVFTKSSKEDQAKFDQVYSEANDKYNEGVSLKDLNAPLAQESFQDAQNILNANKDTFKDGSDEDNQIEDLLSKVNSELRGSDSSSGTSSTATEASKSDSKLLAAEIDNTGSAFTQNDDFIYYIDNKGVTKIDKGNDKSEAIIDKDWKTAGGIGTFGSNVYVLDKTDNVLKFAPSGSDFAKSDYFASDAPDFSSSVDMAIDGSVYVLNKDGSIKKYTRGKEDAFEVSGLTKALSNPSKIYTNENTDNVYILDNGNSRVVVLDKDGKFLSEYSADVIKNAKGLDVNESAKNLFVLSGDKIYKIVLK